MKFHLNFLFQDFIFRHNKLSKEVKKLELNRKGVQNCRKRRSESIEASVSCYTQPLSTNELNDGNSKTITESLKCFDDLHATSAHQFYELENWLNDCFLSCLESESEDDESSTETVFEVTFLISELKI